MGKGSVHESVVLGVELNFSISFLFVSHMYFVSLFRCERS